MFDYECDFDKDTLIESIKDSELKPSDICENLRLIKKYIEHIEEDFNDLETSSSDLEDENSKLEDKVSDLEQDLDVVESTNELLVICKEIYETGTFSDININKVNEISRDLNSDYVLWEHNRFKILPL